MAILATNLRENIDDAFARRIRFLVDFPFPDAERRQQIWRTHFPAEAPTGRDIDFAWLGQQLQITGGNIKNIALNAAFLAAEDGGEIAMASCAPRREAGIREDRQALERRRTSCRQAAEG